MATPGADRESLASDLVNEARHLTIALLPTLGGRGERCHVKNRGLVRLTTCASKLSTQSYKASS